jgi:hypothetical protein
MKDAEIRLSCLLHLAWIRSRGGGLSPGIGGCGCWKLLFKYNYDGELVHELSSVVDIGDVRAWLFFPLDADLDVRQAVSPSADGRAVEVKHADTAALVF